LLALSKSALVTSTFGAGDAGNIRVNATDTISLDRGSLLEAATGSSGDAGDILITAPTADISFNGQETSINATVSSRQELNSPVFSGSFVGKGQGGNITIQANNLSLTNSAFISTETGGEVIAEGLANAGNLKLDITDSITLSSEAVLTSQTEGAGNAGDLTINTNKLTVEDAGIEAETLGSGDGGSINIKANDILLTGNSKEDVMTGIGASTSGSGNGGTINIDTNNLIIQDNAKFVNVGISVGSLANGNAGKIFAQVGDALKINNGTITSFSDRSSGGEISISAGNIRLTGNSNISTFVNSGGNGGNLTLSADSIVAFDDSDILASSRDGVGGNITLDTDAFFSNNFNPALLNAKTNIEVLDGNNQVDINASGAVDGSVELPNVNFLPNSLIRLSDETINTEEVVSNSCVVPSQQQGGTFIVYGRGGLVVSPNDAAVSAYATGDVRNLPQKQAVFSRENWQPGKPIVEPEGMYRLSNGQLVLSRQCN
jgi:large exoprotein involved in heme utilization and adhesion